MKIYLNEITEQESEFDFTQDESWTLEAVQRVDETSDDEEDAAKAQIRGLRVDAAAQIAVKHQPRPINAHFSLRKVDEVVVLSGHVDTYVTLVCSRCANS